MLQWIEKSLAFFGCEPAENGAERSKVWALSLDGCCFCTIVSINLIQLLCVSFASCTCQSTRILFFHLIVLYREIMREINRMRRDQMTNSQLLHSASTVPSSNLLGELKALRMRKQELEQHMNTLQDSRKQLMDVSLSITCVDLVAKGIHTVPFDRWSDFAWKDMLRKRGSVCSSPARFKISDHSSTVVKLFEVLYRVGYAYKNVLYVMHVRVLKVDGFSGSGNWVMQASGTPYIQWPHAFLEMVSEIPGTNFHRRCFEHETWFPEPH